MAIFGLFFNFVKTSNSLKVGLRAVSHKNVSLSRTPYVIFTYFLLPCLEMIWKMLQIVFMNERRRGSEPNGMMPAFSNRKGCIQTIRRKL